MYAYLNGTVAYVSADNCIIDVGGIGYNVRISANTAQNLPSIGENVKIYTYTSVREDAISLIGFLKQSDLEMFRLLITVNGIGPKGGLAILSVMDADMVRFTIMSGDVGSLSKAPGVGKKSAERVILELRSKMDNIDWLISDVTTGAPAVNERVIDNDIIKEAAEALTALGYNSAEALKAVRSVSIDEGMDVENVLKLALKELY